MKATSTPAAVSEAGERTSIGYEAVGWLRQYWPRLFAALALIGVTILAAVSPGPIHSAIQIGGDEFFEVTKGLLWAHGYPPFGKVWNDQPPLHTAFLAMAFRCFGPTIGVARGVAVGFGLLLLTGFFILVKKRCGIFAAFVAVTCFLVAPQVPGLCVSVMLEAPAIGTALWALWAIYQWTEKRRTQWLVVSGFLLAAAMQIKLTAAVTGPALALEILLASRGTGRTNQAKDALRNLIIWSGSFTAAFLFLGFALGGNYELLWASHFSPQMFEEWSASESRAFSFRLLVDHTEALWGLGAGLFVVAARQEWRRLAFPLIMLFTVSIIHFHHRPWWDYYYLHFAVSLAWMAGYGVAELLRKAMAGSDDLLGRVGNWVASSALCSLLMVSGGSRLWDTISVIEDSPRVENNPLIGKMKQYATHTKWVYAKGAEIYPFHARLLAIPELAVIPAKRIWSGRLTDEQILAILKEYQPELLLLQKTKIVPGMEQLVKGGYVPVYEDDRLRLYVVKSLAGK